MGAIGFLLAALFISLTVLPVIGAVVLRAAIRLYNTITGVTHSTSAVPEPDFANAIAMALLSTVATVFTAYMVALADENAAGTAEARGSGINLTAQLTTLPISVLAMTVILCVMLPTTLLRAFVVTLGYLLIAATIVGGIGAIAFVALRP
jgi:hypothetical protein